MKKIVFYSFFDNYRRCKYVDMWKRAFPEEAKHCVFVEVMSGMPHPRARKMGYRFLHSGDPRSMRIYSLTYEKLGIPAVNVRLLGVPEAPVEKKPKGIEILEISPVIRKTRGRKAKADV